MRVVALLAVRNEELYMERCLEHLWHQGIETCVIDNGSTDRTLEIAEKFRGRGVFRIEHLPFNGRYQWKNILEHKEKLAEEIEADWFIHHDADEIRQSPNPYRTLLEGIEDANRQGYNAINFDEFVFLPGEDESFEGKDYVKEMPYYYFLEPRQMRRINAWKKAEKRVNLTNSGGHMVEFDGRRIFPAPFILRHYIFLGKAHALRKYAGRVYSAEEVSGKWHGKRAFFKPESLVFTERGCLKVVSADNIWDKSEPWKRHEFFGNEKDTGAHDKIHGPKKSLYRKIKGFFSAGGAASTCPPMPFIVGVSRSGTTLLRLMLDAHPELAIPYETHFIPRILRMKKESRGEFFRIVTETHTWRDFHIPEELFLERLDAIKPFTVSDGLRCFYRLYAKRFNKKRWGDKTPLYNLYMSGIQNILPEAHFIHLIRDGRDVAASLRKLWFGPGSDIEAQASDWLYRIREARQQAQLLNHYMEVRYEDLITDTTNVLKNISNFIDIPYDKGMERYYESAEERLDELNDWRMRDKKTVKKEDILNIHRFLNSPPQPSRIGRWKEEISSEDRRKFEAIAGDMLRDLGYEI